MPGCFRCARTRFDLSFLAAVLMLSVLLPLNIASAQPNPEIWTDQTHYTPFPGESLSFCFHISNSGNENGFRPVIEMIVPVDLSFREASFLGAPVDYVSYETSSTGHLIYKIGRYERVISAYPGAKVILLMPPINNIPPNEAAPDVCVNLEVSKEAAIGRDHLVNSTLIFAYGSDPLDNPDQDPPRESSPLQVSITPSLMKVRKELGSGFWSVPVIPIGPNYAFNYTIIVSLAERVFKDLVIEDILPKEAVYVRLVSVENLTGGELNYVVESEPSPGDYGGNLTIRIPEVRGNSGDTIRVSVSMYLPFYDEQGDELIGFNEPRSLINPVNVRATYEGEDVRASGSLEVIASSMTYQKGVSIYRDNYAEGPSRFDILKYTIAFWLSDYYNVSVITFSDALGDGQRVLRNMTPVFYVVNGSTIYSGSFPDDAYSFGDDHSGPNGITPLFFNLTRALEGIGARGDLRGGMVGNESWHYSGGDFKQPFGRGRTWGYVSFWAYVEDEYSSTVPGDQYIDSGDRVRNEVTMEVSYSGSPTFPPNIDRITEISIPEPQVEKSIAYLNGEPAQQPVLVKAGDNVTFRLRIRIPTANADRLEFYDQLPLPIFRVNYDEHGQTPFYVRQSPSSNVPPGPGEWAIGPEDNVTSTTGLIPELFLVDETANKLGFRYNSPIHAGNGSLLVVDVMYTLTVTDEPFGDLLGLANIATLRYSDSFSTVTSEAAIGILRTESPILSIRKDVISTEGEGYVIYGYLYDADAGDLVTFQVNVTNEGHNAAHDVIVRDDVQVAGSDYFKDLRNLGVYGCDGTTPWDPSSYSIMVYPSASVPQYLEISLKDNVVLPPGGCIVLRYDLTIGSSVRPSQHLQNNASITRYASVEGGDNFVDPNDPPRDDAIVFIRDPQFVKGVLSTSNPDSPGDDLSIGEEVVFYIDVSLPEGSVYAELTDTWPEGFSYLNHTIDASQLGGSLDFEVNVDEDDRKLKITFYGTVYPNNNPGDDIFTVTLALRVLNHESNVGHPWKGLKENFATLSWEGIVTSRSKEVYIVEPHLYVSKSFNVSLADAGDWVRITIGLGNNGFAPSYEVNLTDLLDPAVFDLSSVSEVSTPGGFTFSLDPSSGTVRYEGGRVGVGNEVLFVMDARIRDDVISPRIYVNSVNAKGSSMPGHLTDERVYTSSGTARLTIGRIVPSKALVGTSEPSTQDARVTIGEIVLFDLSASVPEGRVRNVTFYEILPRDGLTLLYFMNANVTVNRGGVNSSEVQLIPGSWVSIQPSQQDNTLAFYLGDITNSNNDPEDEVITIRVKLLVPNLEGNYAGRSLTNRFRVGYTNATDKYVYTSEVQSALTVVEPQLWSILTAEPITVGWIGDEVILHFNVTNLATTTSSTAFELQLLQNLPPELSSLQVLRVDSSSAGGIVDLSADDQLRILASYLEPGGWINVTFRSRLQPNAVFGQSIPLIACSNGTTTPGDRGSWNQIPGEPGSQNGERIGTGVEPNHIRACDDASITVGIPNVNKDVLTPKLRYAPGDRVRYQITVGTPKGRTDDLKVVDTLAEGLKYANDLEIEVPTGVTFSNEPSDSPPFFSHQDTGTTEILTFDFGNFTNGNSGGVNTYLRFDAVVENHPENSDGKVLWNEAVLRYLDASGSEKAIGPSQVGVTVGEPRISSLGKETLSDLRGGEVTWFILFFTNDGTTTAYDVILTDYLPPELRGGAPVVNYVRIDDRTLDESDYSTQYFDSNGTFRIELLTPGENSNARVEPGERVEIMIGARAIPQVPLNYQTINEFRVRAYSSRPGTVDEERVYEGGSANARVSSPGPEVRKVVLSTRTPPPDPNDPTRSDAVVGEVISYNVTFKMPRGTIAYDVRFSDTLPDGLEVINATATGINGTQLISGTTIVTESSGRYYVEASFGKLVDAEVNVTIYARVRYYYSDGTPVRGGDVLRNGNSTNVCKYTYGNGVNVFEVRSNEVLTRIISSSADLRISKSFSKRSMRLGDTVTATISVINVGNGTSYETLLRDVFCDNFEFLDANVTPVSVVGNVITWSVGELDPGEGWAVAARFRLRGCGCFNDNATVSWVYPGDPSTVREAEASDSVAVVTDLDFRKDVDPSTLRVGETARFSLLVTNPTCRTIVNLNFTDVLPSGMSYVPGSSKLNGSAIGDPYILNGVLIWNTSLTVNPGESYLLEFLAKAEHWAREGDRVNRASVFGLDPSGTTISAEGEARLYIRGERGSLSVSKSADRIEVGMNDTVTFRITITNNYDVPLYNVDVWDLLPCCLTYAGTSEKEPEHPSSLPPGYATISVPLQESEMRRCEGDRVLKWHFDRIDPGETIVISFQAKVKCAGVLTNAVDVFCVTEGGRRVHGGAETTILAYSVPKAPHSSYSTKVSTITESALGSEVPKITESLGSGVGGEEVRGEAEGGGMGHSEVVGSGSYTPTPKSGPTTMAEETSLTAKEGSEGIRWTAFAYLAIIVTVLLILLIVRRSSALSSGPP
ncbi:MAG: isopeptide-forming domain-containing fimbrial protein [Candidatus Korarchaeum sp.]